MPANLCRKVANVGSPMTGRIPDSQLGCGGKSLTVSYIHDAALSHLPEKQQAQDKATENQCKLIEHTEKLD